MNDLTHDDSSFVLDRAITFHLRWAIERQASGLYAWYDPDKDDHGAVSLSVSLDAAREAIDAAIAEEAVEK